MQLINWYPGHTYILKTNRLIINSLWISCAWLVTNLSRTRQVAKIFIESSDNKNPYRYPFRGRDFCLSLDSTKILATCLVLDKLATSHAQDIHKLLIIRRFVFRMYVCPGYQFINCIFSTPYLCVSSCNLQNDWKFVPGIEYLFDTQPKRNFLYLIVTNRVWWQK